eukprot:TRINITY_DN8163_c2_g2_i2.p1 TRINITY_DN8163_c2_g2~~TRINITY_DN8163_c2_g2_i2.p1  ORF type:complete len:1044 (+),score=498.71 TRINITY_DN8163_c2_g2_i2:64-3132(+)
MPFNPSSLGDAPMLGTRGKSAGNFGEPGSPRFEQDGEIARMEEERLLREDVSPLYGERQRSRSSKSKKDKKDKRKKEKKKERKPAREGGATSSSSAAGRLGTTSGSVRDSASSVPYTDGAGDAPPDYEDDFEVDDDVIPTVQEEEERARKMRERDSEREREKEREREREREREAAERKAEEDERREAMRREAQEARDREERIRAQEMRLQQLREESEREEERLRRVEVLAAQGSAAAVSSGPDSVHISDGVRGVSHGSHRYSAGQRSDTGSPSYALGGGAQPAVGGAPFVSARRESSSINLEVPPGFQGGATTPRASGALTPRRGSKTMSPQPALAAATQAQLQHEQDAMHPFGAAAAQPAGLSDAATLQMQQQMLAAPAVDPATLNALVAQALLQQRQRDDDDADSRGRKDRSGRKERERRARREREWNRKMYLASEEDAAGALMKRLACDVKAIFQELNTSIVAAERERHIKEERYRKDREARDLRWTDEREQRDDRERREREEREERFWSALQEREREAQERREAKERQFHEDITSRYREMEHEREQRSIRNREADEKARRVDDESFRDREKQSYRIQLEMLQQSHRQQLEELSARMQGEVRHLQELRSMEVANIEKRHQHAIELQKEQHEASLRMLEVHGANARRLEGLVAQVRDEIAAVGDVHVKVNQERQAVLHEQEARLEDQMKLQAEMQAAVQEQRELLKMERDRVVSLYGRFEAAIQEFSKTHQAEGTRLQEATVRAERQREVADQERKRTLQELYDEQQRLEEMRSRLAEERRESARELQEERLAVARERGDLLMRREDQGRAEQRTLQSLVSREETAAEMVTRLKEDLERQHEREREVESLRDSVLQQRKEVAREREAVDSEKARLHEVARKAVEESARAREMQQDAATRLERMDTAKAAAEMLQRQNLDDRDELERRGRTLRFMQHQINVEKSETARDHAQRLIGLRQRPSTSIVHTDPVRLPHGGATPPPFRAAEIAREQRFFLDAVAVGADLNAVVQKDVAGPAATVA